MQVNLLITVDRLIRKNTLSTRIITDRISDKRFYTNCVKVVLTQTCTERSTDLTGNFAFRAISSTNFALTLIDFKAKSMSASGYE